MITSETRIDGSVLGNQPAIVTQLSEEEVEVDNQRPPIVEQETFSETEKCTHQNVEAALNCCFHVMQNFSDRKSFVGDFVDKSHCDTKNGGEAHKHVQLIHCCETVEMRLAVTLLVLRHWRDAWGKELAAKKFEEQCYSFPFWNWSYSSTNEVGVLPSNCPNESLNKLLKTGTMKNVSLPRSLVQTMPALLQEDANV